MEFLLFAAESDVTRPTLWQIGPVGEAVFYYLSAVAILIFAYGLYDRFARYTRGTTDPFQRLNNLPSRILRAATFVASNRGQFDRDTYAGIMHTFIFWGFLTLFIGTSILAFEMDIWTKALGQPHFFQGAFYLPYSLIMDAMGLLFVVGIGMAIYRRYWVQHHRLFNLYIQSRRMDH